MRFMTMVKSRDQAPPPPALIDAINRLIADDAQKGTLVETGGLLPTEHGARVRLANGKISVTDGPFTEAKEVIGGYAILNLNSKQEAVEAAVALFELHRQYWPGWEGEAEVRQMMDAPVDVQYTPHR
jgi:hypothetical protein